jgi:hypothetical protein
VFKLPGDVAQLFPSYSSVAPTFPADDPVVEPPKANAAVCVPACPAKASLAVFKLLLAVQEVPSYSSVSAKTGEYPPKAKAAV